MEVQSSEECSITHLHVLQPKYWDIQVHTRIQYNALHLQVHFHLHLHMRIDTFAYVFPRRFQCVTNPRWTCEEKHEHFTQYGPLQSLLVMQQNLATNKGGILTKHLFCSAVEMPLLLLLFFWYHMALPCIYIYACAACIHISIYIHVHAHTHICIYIDILIYIYI